MRRAKKRRLGCERGKEEGQKEIREREVEEQEKGVESEDSNTKGREWSDRFQ